MASYHPHGGSRGQAASAPFRVRVPATSANLGPGLDCLGVAVGLYLDVECQPAETFRVELSGEGHAELPRDAENLLARCVRMGLAIGQGVASRPGQASAQEAAARPEVGPAGANAHGKPENEEPDLPDVRLSIHNDIPLARGLGSSSAAIVAGLATGMTLAQLEPGAALRRADEHGPMAAALDKNLLCNVANRIEGHPDNVAPATLGDLIVSGVEHDEIITLGLRWPASLRFVAVIPELAIRTEDARRALPKEIPFADAVLNGARLARFLGALQTGRFDQLRTALEDRLHQPYRLPLAKGLAETLAALSRHPQSLGAYLSGSGPTVMALCLENEEALGQVGVDAFAASGVRARAIPLQVDRTGLVVTLATSR